MKGPYMVEWLTIEDSQLLYLLGHAGLANHIRQQKQTTNRMKKQL